MSVSEEARWHYEQGFHQGWRAAEKKYVKNAWRTWKQEAQEIKDDLDAGLNDLAAKKLDRFLREWL
jgi:hypothetical protein